jgi:hypothetical protein
MARWRTRDLVYIGLFGALWGALEFTLGSWLHVLEIPVTGMIMGAVGLTIALMGTRFVPHRGAVLGIGVVSAALKALSLGGVVLNPMLGILMESALAELTLLVLGRERRGAFIAAGALGAVWNVGHPFVTNGLIGGMPLFEVYTRLIDRGLAFFGLPPEAVWAVLGTLAGMYLLAGGLAGWIAWEVSQAVRARLTLAASEEGSGEH